MGATFNYQKLLSKTAENATEEGINIIKQTRYDHGYGGYSGSFAEVDGVCLIEDKVILPEDAENWLDDHTEKWSNALIIRDTEGSYHMGALCSD